MNLHVHDVSPEMMKKAKARAVEEGKSLKEWVLGVLEKELSSQCRRETEDRQEGVDRVPTRGGFDGNGTVADSCPNCGSDKKEFHRMMEHETIGASNRRVNLGHSYTYCSHPWHGDFAIPAGRRDLLGGVN